MESIQRARGGLALLVVSGGFCLLACHGNTHPQVPTTFAKTAGDNQRGTAGATVATTPAVIIKDADGKGIPALAITFTVTGGGGTITGGTATTDANGVATLGTWTLGTTAGINTLVAASAVTLSGSPLTFTDTGVAGPAATITKVSVDPLSPPAGSNFDSIVVRIADQFGNPVARDTVTFAITAGGGSVSPVSTVTNAAGFAGARWTLGNSAFTANSATATRPGLTSSIVTFGTTTSVAQVRFASRTMVVDSSATFTPTVVAFDGFGNAVPSATFVLVTRSAAVATASASSVTGIQPGQTFLIAMSADNSTIMDSAVVVVANVNAPVVTATVPRFDLKSDTTFTVPFIVDMRSSGEKLGSATLQITWDPSILTYVSDADGAQAVNATVNATGAASGALTMDAASLAGFGGVIEIRKVTFKASSVAGRTGLPLRVFILDMAGATTLTNLQPKTVAATYPLRTR